MLLGMTGRRNGLRGFDINSVCTETLVLHLLHTKFVPFQRLLAGLIDTRMVFGLGIVWSGIAWWIKSAFLYIVT